MSIFSSLPKEKATVEKPDGQIVGPYTMVFAGDTIIVPDKTADIDKGDVIIRTMPSGKEKCFTVSKSTFHQKMTGMSPHHQIKFEDGRVTHSEKSNQTINIHSPQAVQIGDSNTQQITSTIQMLVQRIDDCNATDEEKTEAKSLLEKFLSHPLVTTVVGATIDLGGS